MFDKNKVKLGIAPIAWTNDDLPDLGAENTFEQCVSEMALAGFNGQTGKIVADRPISAVKAAAYGVIIFVVVLIITMIGGLLFI